MLFERFSPARRCYRCCCFYWQVSCWCQSDEDSIASCRLHPLVAVDCSTNSSSDYWSVLGWLRCSSGDVHDSRPDSAPCSRMSRCSVSFANCAGCFWNRNVALRLSTLPYRSTVQRSRFFSKTLSSSMRRIRASHSQCASAKNWIFPMRFLQSSHRTLC